MNSLTTATLTHDNEMAREFLAALDPTAETFTFQFFSDDREKRYAEIFHGTLDEVWPKIQALNTEQRGVGVFVAVNKTDGKGRSRKNIVRVRALPIDADDDEQVARCEKILASCGVVPNITVKTGRGRHYYFCADDVECDEFTNLLEALIERLGTDKSVKDVTRVMRLPGTYHLKNPQDPRLVTLERATRHPHWTKEGLAIAMGFGFASKSPADPVHAAPSHTDENRVVIGDFPAPSAWVQKHFGHLTDRLSDGLEADLDEIRSAAFAIPASALASEHEWVRIARAMAREAAVYPANQEKLYAILDEVSRRAPGYHEEDNRRRFERYITEAFERDRPITIATLFDLAGQHGWPEHIPVPSFNRSALPAPMQANAPRALPISSLPQTPRKREWLCGTYLMRGAISLLSAPGARGKTAWLITLAISCASGRPAKRPMRRPATELLFASAPPRRLISGSAIKISG